MLTDLEELARKATAQDGRGGKRPGAGRKKKDGTNSATVQIDPGFEIQTADELLLNGTTPPPLLGDPSTDMGAIDFSMPDNPIALFAGAKARKEAAQAATAELNFRIKAGMYLPRDSVRSSVATAFQVVVQTLRSIPDNLERRFGIQPEVASDIGAAIDEAMGELSMALEQIHTENTVI